MIIEIESGDPHLVVKCVKSLITMPYLSQDDVYLARQIITIAVDMAHNDSTVIRAIEKIVEIVKELVNIYKTMVSRHVVVYFRSIFKFYCRGTKVANYYNFSIIF